MTTDQTTIVATEGVIAVPVTTSDLREMLRKRFAFPDYLLLEEVSNREAGTGQRYADGIAIGLSYARGNPIEGFEVKVSRADWLAELKDPRKADAFFRFCDHWWVVAPSTDVVHLEDLPDRWGLLIPRKDGTLHSRAKAAKLNPDPIDHRFLASVVFRMRSQNESAIQAAVSNAVEKAETLGTGTDDYYRGRAEKLEALITAFEEKSGISLHAWHPDPAVGRALGVAVSAIQNREVDSVTRRLELQRRHLFELCKDVDEALKAIRAAAPPGDAP